MLGAGSEERAMTQGWIDVHGHFNIPALRPHPVPGWTFAPATSIDFMDRTSVAAQLLSNYGPQTTENMIAANDQGAAIVASHPDRFGLLAQLPMAEPESALAELRRGIDQLDCEGFAIQSNYRGVYLGDPRFEPVWAELDRRRATLFIHPTPLGYEDTRLGRPGALIEATFDTARSIVDMLYTGVFRRYGNFNVILAHAGGALPALAGRLETLGPWPLGWTANPQHVTAAEMRETFARLYYDTALAGTPHSLDPVLDVTTPDHVLYGADFGAPCTYIEVCQAHYDAVRNNQRLTTAERDAVGRNALRLFPKFARRVAAAVRVAAE
jgi:predicted TIM-barrel fold metal-dependent hydrolase